LIIVGCATNQPQPSSATQTQLEKKDMRHWSKEEGRVPWVNRAPMILNLFNQVDALEELEE
jgi:hypothetical protein